MLRRHDLLRVEDRTWDGMLRCHRGLSDEPLVADWARLGRPVIVRRRMPGDHPHAVPAALPLPPSHGKRRIAFGFVSLTGLTAMEPVLLRDAARTAPAAWQEVIEVLLEIGGAASTPRVFGALLWQHVTGLSYLTARSDLDLLWKVADERGAEALVGELAGLEARGVRLDGELELPDGAWVNWREFAGTAGPTTNVLVKTMDGVQARSRTGLFDALAQVP